MKFSNLSPGSLFRFEADSGPLFSANNEGRDVWYLKLPIPLHCKDGSYTTYAEQWKGEVQYLKSADVEVFTPECKADYVAVLYPWRNSFLHRVYDNENFPGVIIRALIEGFEYSEYRDEKIATLIHRFSPEVDVIFRRYKGENGRLVALFPSRGGRDHLHQIEVIGEVNLSTVEIDLHEVLSVTSPVPLKEYREFKRNLETTSGLVLNVVCRPTESHERIRSRLLQRHRV